MTSTSWRFIDFGYSSSLNCSCLRQYFVKYTLQMKCKNYTWNTEILKSTKRTSNFSSTPTGSNLSTISTGTNFLSTPMRRTSESYQRWPNIKPHQRRPTTQVHRRGYTTKFYRNAITENVYLPEYVIVIIVIAVFILGFFFVGSLGGSNDLLDLKIWLARQRQLCSKLKTMRKEALSSYKNRLCK